MRLKLVVRDPEGASSNVVVECRPDAPARDVLGALARHLGLAGEAPTSGRCERSHELLAGDVPIGDADLRDGDLLVLSADGAATVVGDGDGRPTLVDLVVVGGPDSGRRVGLPEGEHVIGRGPGADVVLSDRSMPRRHLRGRVGPDAVTVCDAGSSNGTFLGDAPLTADARVAEGQVVEAGRTLLRFHPHGAQADARPDGRLIAFNRPPRVARPKPNASWSVSVPAAATTGSRLSPALLLPVAAGVILFIVTGRAYTLLFALLAPVMALVSAGEGGRERRRRRADELGAFERTLDEVSAAAQEARTEEVARRRTEAPDASELYQRAAGPAATLWERRPTDDDFLALRLGTSDLPAEVTVEVAEGGDPELRQRAIERLAPDSTLSAVPLTAPLRGGAIGVVGDPGRTLGLARWLIAQAAILHSHRDLEIVAVVDPDHRADWTWLRWLPHVPEDGVIVGAAAAGAELARPASAPIARLVLVDGDLGLPPTFAEGTLDKDTAIVWLARRALDLPSACTVIAALDERVDRLEVTDVTTGATTADVAADGVSEEWVEEVARLLAPARDTGASEQAAAIPSRVSLLELLGMPDPTPTAVAQRWSAGGGSRAAAPIGVAAGGPFEIDVARTDGLRMVLAGMPGAGKSELLQALIASLAVTYPPTRLAFLLVDYKGGAAFRDCVDLPHTAGLITDLDAGLAERARVSLLAELRRREALLHAAGARNLRELVATRPDDAPPALVIVVDEFATLARELPAVVDTIVDVAQRGRSLGLHLVLATQRPRGAVSEAIRANTNLRVAMRVADAGESQDVIEAADAAAIPAALPGRAIALTSRDADGTPQLTPFQSGYAGGTTSGILDASAVTVRALDDDGPNGGVRVVSAIGAARPTDLQTVVVAVREAATRLQLAAPTAPWLPPLPSRCELDALPAAGPGCATVGLVDDPARQAQEPLVVDLDQEGSVLVYGASGSGKTALLRAIGCSLAEGHSPRDLELYALDFASRGLLPLEDLPHCGSVISADDPERALRLIANLQRGMESRRRQMADGGARAGERGLPRIVLLLDGYANFTAAFERVDFGAPVQALGRLAADGRALGLHVVMTADRRADVPGSLAGVVPTRIVLRRATDDEYAALGLPRARNADRDLPAGRGFTADGRELQVAWVAPDEIPGRGRRLQAAHPGVSVAPVGSLPAMLERERLPAPQRPLRAVVGIDDALLAPVELDLADGHALLAGPHRSGLSTALATIALSLRRGDPRLSLYLLAPRRSPLRDLDLWTAAATDPEGCAELAGRLAAGNEERLVVIVDDGIELAEGPAAAALEALLRRGRDATVRVVAALDLHGAQRVFGGWVRDLRAERNGLLLQPQGEGDGDLLGVRVPALRGGPPPAGRGFLVERGMATLVQIAAAGQLSKPPR
jgi:DNA segregation ATPase FtsK/SpoIIIE, S-DNA-T family